MWSKTSEIWLYEISKNSYLVGPDNWMTCDKSALSILKIQLIADKPKLQIKNKTNYLGPFHFAYIVN